MSVNPGMEFLEQDMIQTLGENLTPGEDPIIPVPPSGGIIIQGAEGIYQVMMPDGTINTIDSNGNLVP